VIVSLNAQPNFADFCFVLAVQVKPVDYSLAAGFVHLGAGLACGFTGMAAGYAIGIVGDSVRAALKTVLATIYDLSWIHQFPPRSVCVHMFRSRKYSLPWC
jgi:ATP synthase subunit C